MSERYSGLCAGGPHNGKLIASEAPVVNIPIQFPETNGIGQGSYKFNSDVKMWIWQGEWPLKPKNQP